MTLYSRSPVALVGATDAAIATLKPAREMLARFGVPSLEVLGAEAMGQTFRAIIVASADAALPAALAAETSAPVIRAPSAEGKINDRLQLLTGPRAFPGEGSAAYATMAIGEAGARNAALLVVSILALNDERLRAAWAAFRQEQTAAVLRQPPPS